MAIPLNDLVPMPEGSPAPGGWFESQGAPGGGGAAQGEDSQAYLQRMLATVPYGPEGLRSLKDQLKAAGYTVNIDSSGGVRGRITNDRTGEFYDVTGPGEGLDWGRNPQATSWGFTYHAADPGGGGAGGTIGAGLENTPGYQFRLGEGLKALERSAAARGTLLTGGTLKGLERYAQDYASGEYEKRVNQLMGLSTLGRGAAGAQASLGSQYGSDIANLTTGAGNAQAAGTIGRANAWSDMLSSGSDMAQLYYLRDLMNPRWRPPALPPIGGAPDPSQLPGRVDPSVWQTPPYFAR